MVNNADKNAEKALNSCSPRYEDAEETTDDAQKSAGEHLPQVVLAQHHSAASYEAGYEDAHAHPTQRVEGEEETVAGKGTDDTTCTSTVHGNLPPHIDEQAAALNQQRADEDA